MNNLEAKQEVIKLVTLSEFIKEINAQFPSVFTWTEMQDILIKKYKSICKYNDFLQQKLTIEMFEGDNKIFIGGIYVDLQPSIEYNYYRIGNKMIFRDGNTYVNGSLGFKIEDIAGRDIYYKPI